MNGGKSSLGLELKHPHSLTVFLALMPPVGAYDIFAMPKIAFGNSI